jgi:putative transcriptional regulator
MIRALEEGIAHVQGRITLRTRTIVVPDAVISDTIDVHAIREKSGLSQSEFAARYGFSFRTVQEWEQGRARPDGAVRAYLTVIDRNPDAVRQALASWVVEEGRVLAIFNIGGNKYRLIVRLVFRSQRIYIKEFLTHAEYDKERWKKWL